MANSGRPHLSPSTEDQATGFWRAIGEEGYKLVKEDPRIVAHAVKVGLAKAALSLLHYYGQASGVDELLTITTLLAVFEYTVGDTLGKGLNPLFATLLGVALRFGVHHLVTLLPEKYEGVIGLSVTFIGFWRAIGEEGYKLVEEDPRRVAHAVKVGLAKTALSLLHYYGQASGVDGLLTITTLLAVFEYTVGATLGKGLNRLFATLLGVALGFGVHHLVTLLLEKYEGVIGLSVTFIGTQ
ncbi:hypothetical protein SASPL_142974 [Salvia splendens]|uniref:Uncharacterized protein n=1 Tax=Salvia splendens TaxID=180675 RepID=A0A8X8WKW7_SALSN|nr:hypothetical protein SASPL_142974 [Salvia splendens]